MQQLQPKEQEVFDKEYMPYITKWGKLTCWASIPLIFLPTLALMIFHGAKPSVSGIVTGLISLVSTMIVWYVVDPLTLFPILHVPGMYLTYTSGNSKEIRAPAAAAALESAQVEAGTPQGTIITSIAISVSVFISVAVMTLVAVAGNLVLSLLPPTIVQALNYMLPALFGAMCVQRIMMDYKAAMILLPCAFLLRHLNINGAFKFLPLGGGYAQILLCVGLGVVVSKYLYQKKQAKAKA